MSAPVGVTNGCTGKCCALFTLTRPVQDLSEAELATIEDGEQICGMVEKLSLDEARDRAERFDLLDFAFDDADNTYYRCTHWDEETMRCGIYADRPAVCRRYPYGRGCSHDPDCTCFGELHAVDKAEVELEAMRSLFRTRPLAAFPRPPAVVGPTS
jgi:Fe-S-cluster containining protein